MERSASTAADRALLSSRSSDFRGEKLKLGLIYPPITGEKGAGSGVLGEVGGRGWNRGPRPNGGDGKAGGRVHPQLAETEVVEGGVCWVVSGPLDGRLCGRRFFHQI